VNVLDRSCGGAARDAGAAQGLRGAALWSGSSLDRREAVPGTPHDDAGLSASRVDPLSEQGRLARILRWVVPGSRLLADLGPARPVLAPLARCGFQRVKAAPLQALGMQC
jgi:hypothetical protein